MMSASLDSACLMAFARLRIEKDLIGPILDLGGGGEGVIGQIYRQQAVVIDNRQEELDETPLRMP